MQTQFLIFRISWLLWGSRRGLRAAGWIEIVEATFEDGNTNLVFPKEKTTLTFQGRAGGRAGPRSDLRKFARRALGDAAKMSLRDQRSVEGAIVVGGRTDRIGRRAQVVAGVLNHPVDEVAGDAHGAERRRQFEADVQSLDCRRNFVAVSQTHRQRDPLHFFADVGSIEPEHRRQNDGVQRAVMEMQPLDSAGGVAHRMHGAEALGESECAFERGLILCAGAQSCSALQPAQG